MQLQPTYANPIDELVTTTAWENLQEGKPLAEYDSPAEALFGLLCHGLHAYVEAWAGEMPDAARNPAMLLSLALEALDDNVRARLNGEIPA